MNKVIKNRIFLLAGTRNLVNRENFNFRVFSGEKPASVWAVSPDFIDYQKLDFTWAGDTAEIMVKYLEAYTLVVLDYIKKPDLYKIRFRCYGM